MGKRVLGKAGPPRRGCSEGFGEPPTFSSTPILNHVIAEVSVTSLVFQRRKLSPERGRDFFKFAPQADGMDLGLEPCT